MRDVRSKTRINGLRGRLRRYRYVPAALCLWASIRCSAQEPPTPPSLVSTFAPLYLHAHDEPNWPANVDWFLPKTHLVFHSSTCSKDNADLGTASLEKLQNATLHSACSNHVYMASGTRSASRSQTFLLTDVDAVYKMGPSDTDEWVTYYHSYDNSIGGVTIQYWLFYPFNTGFHFGPLEAGYHGGDWEMVSVVLDKDSNPVSLRSTGHQKMQEWSWNTVQKSGTHPIVYSEKGGHEAHPDPQTPAPYISHPTWPDSQVVFPNGATTPTGPLVDLGTRLHPKTGFLTYSGLWGSIGMTPFSSGYWGPAFNETGLGADNFLTAWCDQIADPQSKEGEHRECYPDDSQ